MARKPAHARPKHTQGTGKQSPPPSVDNRSQTAVWSVAEVNERQRELEAQGMAFKAPPSGSAQPAFIAVPFKKKRAKWPFVVFLIVAVTLVAAGGVYYFNNQQKSVHAEAYQEINRSIALIQEADTVVVAVDQAIDEQVTEDALPQLEVLTDQVASTKETLLAAADNAEIAKESLTDEDDRELAQHVIDAANTRSEMLNYGKRLVQTDIDAMQSAALLSEAWDLIVGADTDMRAAVDVTSGGNTDAIETAVEFNKAASEKIEEATLKIDDAKKHFPDADFTSISDYLVAKKDAIGLALTSDEALLADDVDLANENNDAYNAKDSEAVELAAKIPSDPMTIITDAYDTVTQDMRASYLDARDRAATSDSYIRTYLGVTEISTTGTGESTA